VFIIVTIIFLEFTGTGKGQWPSEWGGPVSGELLFVRRVTLKTRLTFICFGKESLYAPSPTFLSTVKGPVHKSLSFLDPSLVTRFLVER